MRTTTLIAPGISSKNLATPRTAHRYVHSGQGGRDARIILGPTQTDKRTGLTTPAPEGHALRASARPDEHLQPLPACGPRRPSMTLDPSTVLFWLKKLTAVMLLPPVLPLIPLVIGLLLLHRRPRLGRLLAWSGVALNLLLITPFSVSWLVRQVEYAEALDEAAARSAQAIVVLGAGRRTHAPEFGGETVNRLALERLRYAAQLARRSGLPLLVSGGAPRGDTPEALLMQHALEQDYGLHARWVESASRDTRENAQFSAVHLEAAGVRRILLVTHAMHMKRARDAFEAAGLEVIPAPTAWLGSGTGETGGDQALVQFPSQNTAYAAWFAIHELLGQIAYRWSR